MVPVGAKQGMAKHRDSGNRCQIVYGAVNDSVYGCQIEYSVRF